MHDGHVDTVHHGGHHLGRVRVALLDLLLAHLEVVDVVDGEVAHAPRRAHGRGLDRRHDVDVGHRLGGLARHGYSADAPYQITHCDLLLLFLVDVWSGHEEGSGHMAAPFDAERVPPLLRCARMRAHGIDLMGLT